MITYGTVKIHMFRHQIYVEIDIRWCLGYVASSVTTFQGKSNTSCRIFDVLFVFRPLVQEDVSHV